MEVFLHPGERLYSEKLLGIEGPECTTPTCRAPGRTMSTGWLEGAGWMEFACPEHGPLLMLWKGTEWDLLIRGILHDRSTQSF